VLLIDVTIGCVFKDAEHAAQGLRGVLASGIAAGAVRIGARDKQRADAIAAETGVASDLDPEDPLAGAAGLSSGGAARANSDMGGVIGAVVGAIVGFALGFTPIGAIIAVAKTIQPIACAMLLLVLGGIAGAALGNAFGPQRSTHAGFRLVDAMEEGGIGVVVTTDDEKAPDVMRILRDAGAIEVIAVPEVPQKGQ
jgi:hypothetical protein